jgi:hypothetical protein
MLDFSLTASALVTYKLCDLIDFLDDILGLFLAIKAYLIY